METGSFENTSRIQALEIAYKSGRFNPKPPWERVIAGIEHNVEQALQMISVPISLMVIREEGQRIWVVGNNPFKIYPATFGKTYEETASICSLDGLSLLRQEELDCIGNKFVGGFYNSIQGYSTWVKQVDPTDDNHYATWNKETNSWDYTSVSSGFSAPNLGVLTTLKINLPE